MALNFEAAVAGGIPVVKVMRESLQGNDISRVYGILNGTCNYILTLMLKEGRSFADVLKEAQAQGYAEADPTFDIGGFDTAHKLALLTTLAFGTAHRRSSPSMSKASRPSRPPTSRRPTISAIASSCLAWRSRTESGIEQRVHPTMVPKHTAIAEVDGVSNCVAIDGDFVGDIMLIGPGAGAGPTASSVASDLIDIARGPHPAALRRQGEGSEALQEGRRCAPMKAAITSGSRSMTAPARLRRSPAAWPSRASRSKASSSAAAAPSCRARDARRRLAGRRGHDHPSDHGGRHPQGALAAIERDGHVDAKPQMIRIEKL